MSDRHVETVILKMRGRANKGITKYGVSLERTDLTRFDWLCHAQEEAMDLANYLQVLIDDEYRRTHAPVQD